MVVVVVEIVDVVETEGPVETRSVTILKQPFVG